MRLNILWWERGERHWGKIQHKKESLNYERERSWNGGGLTRGGKPVADGWKSGYRVLSFPFQTPGATLTQWRDQERGKKGGWWAPQQLQMWPTCLPRPIHTRQKNRRKWSFQGYLTTQASVSQSLPCWGIPCEERVESKSEHRCILSAQLL